jgi:hypothetical protein
MAARRSFAWLYFSVMIRVFTAISRPLLENQKDNAVRTKRELFCVEQFFEFWISGIRRMT